VGTLKVHRNQDLDVEATLVRYQFWFNRNSMQHPGAAMRQRLSVPLSSARPERPLISPTHNQIRPTSFDSGAMRRIDVVGICAWALLEGERIQYGRMVTVRT